MSEPARNRFALDLEDLERQLRGAAQAPRPGQATDPLAELTRIVGQDDPLRDVFAHRPQAAVAPHVAPPPRPVRQEPSFAAEAAPPAELRGALDEFEALLRRTDVARPAPAAQPPVASSPAVAAAPAAIAAPAQYDRQSYQPAPPPAASDAPRDLDDAAPYYGYEQPQGAPGEPEMMADDDMPDLEPRRSRKGLWTAAALMAVGVIGVGAAMTFRSSGPTAGNGEPLVITADRGPIKVEPTNPGGAEIPNQNKQIYERAGQTEPTPTKVVSREEQPIDVQQAARSLPARAALPGADPLAQAPIAPERTATAGEPLLTPVPPVPGLGEPRKVRTVAIRPDGTPAGPSVTVANGTSAPLVTGSAAARPATSAGSAEAPRARPAQPPAETAKVQDRAAAPATTPQAPVRVASAAPAPAPAAPATAAIRSGTGDFAVQLAAPGSEAEARATFSALQRKYPDQLRGQTPIVRKTDLAGGKTVFRLRVGPYSREDATTMCTQLQSAGGQCFIAKN